MVEAINDSLVVLDSRIEVLDPLTLVVHTPGWWLVVSEILSVENWQEWELSDENKARYPFRKYQRIHVGGFYFRLNWTESTKRASWNSFPYTEFASVGQVIGLFGANISPTLSPSMLIFVFVRTTPLEFHLFVLYSLFTGFNFTILDAKLWISE